MLKVFCASIVTTMSEAGSSAASSLAFLADVFVLNKKANAPKTNAADQKSKNFKFHLKILRIQINFSTEKLLSNR